MADRLLRNALKSIIPIWLSDRPFLNTAFKCLYAIALMGDLLLETTYEGLQAAFPGVGTDTARPYVAASRGLLQAPNESNAAFAQRCIDWLTTWEDAGSAETLSQQIQGFLIGAGTLGVGVLPTVRIVDRSGNCVTANPDGTTAKTTISWNWDTVLGWDDGQTAVPGGAVASYWSDTWILISPDPFPHYTGTSDALWLSNFGNVNGLGGGHQVPRGYVDGILTLIATWKGAHTWVRNVIWCSDVTTFVPDGSYGNFSRVSNGVQVPGRDPNARYWDPLNG
jgi:hypothetical protein